jgi:hypothetical protein
MNTFQNRLGICVLILLIGLGFSAIKGIFWPDKDICNVSSSKIEGKDFISKNQVKFLPDRVIGTFWTDFYISEKGKMVYDFNEDKTKATFSYRFLPDKYITEYQIVPSYSWWQTYGCYVIFGIILILSLFGEGLLKIVFAILEEV